MKNSVLNRAPTKGGYPKSPVWISKPGMSLFRKVPVSLSEFRCDVITSMLTKFAGVKTAEHVLVSEGACADRL